MVGKRDSEQLYPVWVESCGFGVYTDCFWECEVLDKCFSKRRRIYEMVLVRCVVYRRGWRIISSFGGLLFVLRCLK